MEKAKIVYFCLMEQAFAKFAQRHRSIIAQTPLTFKRFLLAEIHWSSATIALLGPRGVGKTTLICQRLQQLDLPPNQALYIDLGDLHFQELNLIDFAEYFLEQGGQYLFLDEVHRYPRNTWTAEIKSIYDHYRHRLKVVFTGSSVVQILNTTADLSRRVRYYHLPGLSFREYLQVNGITELPTYALSDVLQGHGEILKKAFQLGEFEPLAHFKQYLKRGYYAFGIENDPAYFERVNQSVQLVLGEDLTHANGSRLSDANKISRLLQAIASSVPFKPNISKLADRTGLNRNTIIEYFHQLERAGLLHQLRTEGKGITPLSKPDKIYLDNPNLIYALSPMKAEIGTVRETFFLNQLSTLQRKKLAFPPEISLPKKGDFAYEDDRGRYVFEIGGHNKTSSQIGTGEHHYTVVNAKSTVSPHRIPLWLFGLLY